MDVMRVRVLVYFENNQMPDMETSSINVDKAHELYAGIMELVSKADDKI
jgi:hypothetical protein